VNLNDAPKVNDWLRKLEKEMQATLFSLLDASLSDFAKFNIDTLGCPGFMEWIDGYPSQVVCLSLATWCTALVEADLSKGNAASKSLEADEKCLTLLPESALCEKRPLRRTKIECLITEFVYKDVCRDLQNKGGRATSTSTGSRR